MNVTILNKFENNGGAAKACYRLVKGLKKTNIGIEYFVNIPSSDGSIAKSFGFEDDSDNFNFESLVRLNYIEKFRTQITNTTFSFSFAHANIFNKILTNSDIINMHWVEQFLSNRALAKLVDLKKPLVWTLHDMKPFTGGCHYSNICEGYISNCSNCPQLAKDPYNLTRKVLDQKKEIFDQANLTIVAPSKWLAYEASRSALFKNKKIKVIPYSLDTAIFHKKDKRTCKIELGLNPESFVLQFGAVDANEQRKGYKELLNSLNICLENKEFKDRCQGGKIEIVCLGKESELQNSLPIKFNNLGYHKDEKFISTVYNATDSYILPTLEDNLPNTILESISCGTPLIGFDTGGIPDLIKHGVNGLIAKKGDVQELAANILLVTLNSNLHKTLSEKCNSNYPIKLSLDRQANEYLSLFNDLISENYNYNNKSIYDTYYDFEFDNVIGDAYRNSFR